MDNGLADADYRICFTKAFKIFLSHKFSAELFSAYIIHQKELGEHNVAVFLMLIIRNLIIISRVIMQ